MFLSRQATSKSSLFLLRLSCLLKTSWKRIQVDPHSASVVHICIRNTHTYFDSTNFWTILNIYTTDCPGSSNKAAKSILFAFGFLKNPVFSRRFLKAFLSAVGVSLPPSYPFPKMGQEPYIPWLFLTKKSTYPSPFSQNPLFWPSL